MKKKRTIAIMMLATSIILTACSAGNGEATNQVPETTAPSEQYRQR